MRNFEPINPELVKVGRQLEEEAVNESLIDSSLLDILSRHVVSYPELLKYVNNEVLLPSAILTPKGLDMVVNELNRNSELYLETMTFLDTLALLDILHYGGNGNGVVSLFRRSIELSRQSKIGSGTLAMESVEKRRGLISHSRADYDVSIIQSEPSVMAVYIFALVCNLYNIILINED